jgi:F-box/WD-40 domain protein MET30
MLPTEISLQILSKLDTISLCKSAQVNRTWRQLADDDVVWHKLCEQHLGSRCRKCGWGLPLLERKRLRQEKRQIQLRAKGVGVEGSLPETEVPEHVRRDTPKPSTEQKRSRSGDSTEAESSPKRQCNTDNDSNGGTYLTRRPWKDVYKTRFKVGSNWKHGRYSSRIIKGHSNGVTCIQEGSNVLGDNVLASGSYDTTVKMFDTETGKLLKTFEGATLAIRCLQFNARQLITGSLDNQVRLYDIETGELKRTLPGTPPPGVNGGILSVHNEGEWLAAGSMDKNVYLWNSTTRETTRLRGHTDFVNCVWLDLPSRTLFSASDDCTICLWDLDAKQVIRRFHGHVVSSCMH